MYQLKTYSEACDKLKDIFLNLDESNLSVYDNGYGTGLSYQERTVFIIRPSVLDNEGRFYTYNRAKFCNKTGQDFKNNIFDFLYHWGDGFAAYLTEAAVSEGIIDPAISASLAFIVAINKWIISRALGDSYVQTILRPSPWRWVKTAIGWVPRTFYICNGIDMVLPNLYFYPARPEGKKLHLTNSFTGVITDTISTIIEQIEQEECGGRYEEDEDDEEDEEPLLRDSARCDAAICGIHLLEYNERATNYFTFKSSPKKLFTTFLGIELELEGYGSSSKPALEKLKDHAIFKRDGSLTRGVEICTAPATLDVHKEIFKPFFEQLKNTNLEALDSCGLHIHIDRGGLTQLHIANIHVLVNSSSNLEILTKLAGRSPNRYCTKQEIGYRVGHLSRSSSEHGGKYAMVNLSPLPTIELRFFAATTDYDKFCTRLELTQAIVDYTRPGETTISLPKISIWENFVNYVKNRVKYYPKLTGAI